MTMSTDRLQQIRHRLRQFTDERDWGQFHNPKNLAMAVVGEAGELAAEVRWVASGEGMVEVMEAHVGRRVDWTPWGPSAGDKRPRPRAW